MPYTTDGQFYEMDIFGTPMNGQTPSMFSSDPGFSNGVAPALSPAMGVPFTGGGMNSSVPWSYQGMGGFSGGMGGFGGGGQLSPQAAAQATAERTRALSNLEGRAADYWKTPLAQGMQSNLTGMMSGEIAPYSQDVQNRMFSQSADQISAAQDAARQKAYARAGASGMGFTGGMENRLANIEGQGALQRQGALTGIQNQAALSNFSARQSATGQANQALGTGYGVTNPLVQQAASARFNTDWGSGIGSDLGGSFTGGAASANKIRGGAARTQWGGTGITGMRTTY